MAGQSQGAFAKLAIDGNKYCFTSFKDESVFRRVDGSEESICGNLDHYKERVTEGIVLPKFTVKMQPTPEEYNTLLPWLGYSESTDVFTPISDFSSTGVTVLYFPVSALWTYSGVQVDKAILRGSKGGPPLELELQCMGTGLTVTDGGSFSASTITSTTPYVFHNLTLSLAGNAEVFQSFVAVEDHKLFPQHNNSTFPTSLFPRDRLYYLGLDTPYTSDEVALLSAFTGEVGAVTSPSQAGYAGSLVATRGARSCTWAYHNLKAEVNAPDVPGREEIRARFWYQAFGESVTPTPPLTITSDITA